MGFLLLGILAGNDNGYSSSLFYVIAYAIMTLGSFGMILLLSRAGFEAENIDDFKGLNQKSKWFAFVMLVLMFSLSGLPPTVGFFAKLFVLQAALDAGYTWLVVVAVLLSVLQALVASGQALYIGLAIFAVLMSLIGSFYYLRVVKVMYFDAPAGEVTLAPLAGARWMLSATAVATLVLGIFPARLMDLCARAITASL